MDQELGLGIKFGLGLELRLRLGWVVALLLSTAIIPSQSNNFRLIISVNYNISNLNRL